MFVDNQGTCLELPCYRVTVVRRFWLSKRWTTEGGLYVQTLCR